MNKLAYTTLVAFVASLLTLVVAAWLVPAYSETGRRVIGLDELALHNGPDSCWKAIDGRVYDVTDYIDQHPTPAAVLTDWCGREASVAWHDQGNGRDHSAFAGRLLAGMEVGVLAGADPAPLPPQPVSGPTGGVDLGTSAYADGSYYAETEPDGRGYIALLEFSVHQGWILGIGFDEVRRNEAGEIDYRKSADLNYAERWRRVSGISQLSAYSAYQHQLVASGHPDGVDALSGATSAYENFVELARELLNSQ